MNCKNCGAPLEEDASFCSYCGARVLDDHITLKFIMGEILDKVLSVDNRLFKTFVHLFSKPHTVIDDYIRGVRKRYFNPFNYLLISITLAGLSTLIMKDYLVGMFEMTSGTNTMDAEAQAFGQKFSDFMYEYQAFITIISLPLYAFISWLVFLNKKQYNYLEHHIIYIFTTAHTSIVSSFGVGFCYITGLDLYWEVSFATIPLILIYNAYVLIRLYKLSLVQFIIKTLYFLLIGAVIFVLFSILFTGVLLLIGGKDFLRQFNTKSKENIQKVEKSLDSIQLLQPNDSLKNIQQQDSIQNEPKTISFYEASSKLNCLS
jgi:hypothetical protein